MESDIEGVAKQARNVGMTTRSFLRDVFVNVLANLIAAAIIYLGGVALNLFPKNSTLIFAASTTLVSLAAAILSFAGINRYTSTQAAFARRIRLIGALIALSGIGLIAWDAYDVVVYQSNPPLSDFIFVYITLSIGVLTLVPSRNKDAASLDSNQ